MNFYGTAPTRAASKTLEIAADGQTYKANLIPAGLFLKRIKIYKMQVKIIKSPITERYVRPGDTGIIDNKTSRIRVNGVWFDFDNRWQTYPTFFETNKNFEI
jgi:hypothetical protein